MIADVSRRTRHRRAAAPAALFALLLAGAGRPAAAQMASLVKDIDPTANAGSSSQAEPHRLTRVGGKLFFTAYGAGIGRELFVSDGTAAGTRLVRDLCVTCSAEPEPVGVLAGRLVFVAQTDQSIGLFASDGTRPGTFRLGGDALVVDRPSETLARFVLASGRLFFIGCTESAGCEPWSSDGTNAGTRMVQDIGPGADPAGAEELTAMGGRVFFLITRYDGSTDPRELWVARANGRSALHVTDLPAGASQMTAAGSHLFLVAETPGAGQELWASDGTAAGTRQVSDFPGETFPIDNDEALTALGDRVYFVADDVLHGNEIWTSDGTPAGTRRVTEFGFSDPFFGHSALMARLGERLLFVATDGLTPFALWKTDGTPESTAKVFARDDLRVYAFWSDPAGRRLLFTTTDVNSSNPPTALWATDGTSRGTELLFQSCKGGCRTVPGFRLDVVSPGLGLFVVRDASFHQSLWATDGTKAGTRLFADLPGLTVDEQGFSGVLLGDEVFFSAAGSVGIGGVELWASDGTPAGLRQVTDIENRQASSNPLQLVANGDRLLFTACVGFTYRQVWSTRGSEETTVQLTNEGFAYCPYSFEPQIAVGDGFFFLHDQTLWRSDGTPAGSVRLGRSYDGQNLTAAGGIVYFVGTDRAVWRSDGTPAGTRVAFTVPGEHPDIQDLTGVGAELYFGVGNEVWRSDGTQSGTRRIMSGGEDFVPHHFTRFGADIYFFSRPEDYPRAPELWRTDGTAAGTSRVKQLENFDGGQGLALVPLPGALLLFESRTSIRLWRSDGTEAGTVELASFCGGDGSVDDPEPTLFGGRVFFAADDCHHGRELWQTDGTAAGTSLVADLVPGLLGGGPSGLEAAGGRLFFGAQDGLHGRELWQSDGTAAGTRLLQDIAPQDFSSDPAFLTATSDRLYFVADDGLHGRELWSLPLSAAAGCQATPTRLCLGGRFAVEIDWQDFQGNRGAGQAVPLTADTGTFWFFNPANVEVIVKVLDGRDLNDHFWVFYGALSSVRYMVTVTDTQTGLARRYFNPSGQLASVADTNGFGPLGAYSTVTRAAAAPSTAAAEPELVSSRTDPAAATGVCTPAAGRLCLGGGRFAVESTWKDFQSHTGTGKAGGLTADTGYFWFFNPDNVEVVLKVLDGRELNGKFWVFYGALSSVEYTLTVTDVTTGAVRTYKNPSGRLASAADTKAF